MIPNRKAIIKLLFSWCVFDYLDFFEDYLTLLFVNANSCAKFSRHTIRITAFYWQNSQYPLYSWMLLNQTLYPYRNITWLELCQKHDVISVSISSKISSHHRQKPFPLIKTLSATVLSIYTLVSISTISYRYRFANINNCSWDILHVRCLYSHPYRWIDDIVSILISQY